MAVARLFLAVELGADLRCELAACQAALRRTFPETKWVRPEAMHLTLHFLGDTPLERLADLDLAIAPVTARTAPFSCEVRAVGTFPSARRPAVVWAGIEAGGARLERLAGQMQEGLADAGFSRDPRPFSAHITIGRVRRDARPDPRGVMAAIERWSSHVFGQVAVPQVTVFASALTPAGPLYEPLHTWRLGGP